MRFSERMGHRPVADVIQVDEMNDSLRIGIWNVLCAEKFGTVAYRSTADHSKAGIEAFSAALWAGLFKLPVDQRPTLNDAILRKIRDHFFKCAWYEVYDFVEFCISFYGGRLITPLNRVLEREMSGYRIIKGKVAPITSSEEVASIQAAIGDNTFPGAGTHLKSALDLLSSKTNPDYRNSIKESISAVESVSCAITGSSAAKLRVALKVLSDKHGLHPALKAGFAQLYGYTSDADGIRHAILDKPQLTQADAIYFLVSCSAFVNYLKSKTTQ